MVFISKIRKIRKCDPFNPSRQQGEGMIRGRGGVWDSLLPAQALSRLSLLGGCRDLKPKVRRAVMFQDA